jgi:hypothetical protein
MSLAPVEYTPELERVIRIPRRRWTMQEAQALADRLTPLLRTAAGEAAGVSLFPLQALGLAEFHQVRGGFFALPVGEGKTLQAWLLPYVACVSRSIYLNPASLMDDRERDFARLAKHWVNARPPARLVSYTALTQANNHDLLIRYKPKLIMADEGDLLRNPDSSMCMRLDEYAELDPDCMFVVLTGTPMRKSIKDICHLLKWTHKKWAPVPLTYKDREAWSNALDERVDMIKRQRPGALLHLAGPDVEARDDLERARIGFQQRLWETPGVIYVDKQSCETPLHLRLLQAPEDPLLDAAFKHFRSKEATPPFRGEPAGYELEGPLEMYRVGRELGCGFFGRPEPMPPTPWREARAAWAKFARQQIGRRGKGGQLLATELMVAKEFKDHPLHVAWKEIRPKYKWKSVAEWVSGSVIGYAREWLRTNTPAIVWCPHVPAGEALSRISGVPFFGAGGLTDAGESILNLPPRKSAICSIQSNKRGRNLQSHTRHLVVGWPQPATDVEQMLGRPHRRGQDDPVYFDVLISCAEHLYAIDMSYREAGFVKVTQGQTQKILIAEIDSSMITNYSGYRWDKEWAA